MLPCEQPSPFQDWRDMLPCEQPSPFQDWRDMLPCEQPSPFQDWRDMLPCEQPSPFQSYCDMLDYEQPSFCPDSHHKLSWTLHFFKVHVPVSLRQVQARHSPSQRIGFLAF